MILRPEKLAYKGSTPVIAIGFASVLLLIGAIFLVSQNHLSALKSEIDRVSADYYTKTELLHNMHVAVSDRSITAHNMLNLDDPFELDQEYMKLQQLATRFVTLKEQFRALPLTSKESQLFEETMATVRESQPLQESIVNAIMNNNRQDITRQLVQDDWQTEQLLYQKINDVIAFENQRVGLALTTANTAYNDGTKTIALLALSVAMLGLLIAALVIRRTRNVEDLLYEQKAHAEITLNAIGDAVITTDATDILNYVNPVAEKILGLTSEDIQGKHISDIIHIYDKDNNLLNLPNCLNAFNDNKLMLTEATIQAQNEENTDIEGSASLIRNENQEIIGKIITFRDVSENRTLSDMLSWQASHDALTGLANRREFERLLHDLLEDAKSNHHHHAMLYIDLDQFKVVNDTCGHIAGDMLLQQLTSILQSKIRSSDVIARLGGDEFGVLLESCNLEKAKTIATELLNAIQTYRFSWKNHVFKVGASIGAVPVDENSTSVVRIMSNADSACYIAKDKGRNRVWLHHADDTEIAQRHGEMALTTLINQALEEGKFTIYKQKIVSLDDDDCDIYELLIRMQCEDGSNLLPMAFIPAAERYTIMPNIDRWMISAAFNILAKNSEKIDAADMISINLSGQSLSEEKFLQFVVNEFDLSGINPERICFEVTETAAIANWPLVTRFISTLRGMGCKFALDDFGSGMSSFTYLRNINVDFIKIDGSFVRNITQDTINREVVKAIHGLGQVMKIKTIAEYVESDQIREELANIGVDYIQGFSVHTPEPL